MTTKLLEALQEVAEADLQELDEKIKTLEAELAMLREARKLVDLKLNGPPEKVKRASPKSASPKSSDDAPNLASRIITLIKIEGSFPIDVLSQRLRVTKQQIAASVHHCPNLKRTGNGDVELCTA